MKITTGRIRSIFLYITLSIVFIFSVAKTADTDRLKKDVIPTFQSINLKIDARDTEYGGNVSMALTVKNPANSFIFHAEDMTLVDIVLSGKEGEISVTYESGEHGRTTLT